MAGVEEGVTCAYHVGRVAEAACDHCARPACEACVVPGPEPEGIFCSRACREASAPRADASERTAMALRGNSIAAGLELWVRSLPSLTWRLLPLGCGLALLDTLLASSARHSLPPWLHDALQPVTILLFIYGIATVATELSAACTGTTPERERPATRLLSWAATWLITTAIVLLGTALFLVPGIVLGLRLFWADEYALMHGASPIEAIRKSWNLTRGHAAQIFGLQFVVVSVGYGLLLIGSYLVLALGFVFNPSTLASSVAAQFVYSLLVRIPSWLGYAMLHAPEIVFFHRLLDLQAPDRHAR